VAILNALFGETRQQALSLFLTHPEERYHLREVARRTGRAVATVQAELASLRDAGIVSRTVSGNRTYCQANPACPIFPELRRIMLKTVGLVDVLRRALGPVSACIEAAFVYGSMASGDAGPRSDVDLMVVGTRDDLALHDAVSEAEETIGRTVNHTLIGPREFRERRAQEGEFISRVLGGPRLAVLADPDAVR
jgi:predicted nucleotidyltransferase